MTALTSALTNLKIAVADRTCLEYHCNSNLVDVWDAIIQLTGLQSLTLCDLNASETIADGFPDLTGLVKLTSLQLQQGILAPPDGDPSQSTPQGYSETEEFAHMMGGGIMRSLTLSAFGFDSNQVRFWETLPTSLEQLHLDYISFWDCDHYDRKYSPTSARRLPQPLPAAFAELQMLRCLTLRCCS